MKVFIENWGPIEKCEYDLDKSLIITYGENNIGKSYAMQTLYLLLKNLIEYAYRCLRYYRNMFKRSPLISGIVMEFVKEERKTSEDITGKLLSVLEKDMEEELLHELNDSFENTFGTYKSILDGNPSITIILTEDIAFRILMKDTKVEVRMKQKPVILKKTASSFHKSKNNKSHYDIYVVDNHVETPIDLAEDKVEELKFSISQQIISKINNVYFLPASRSGIYTGMSSFGPILAQLSQNRANFKGTLQIPSIPEPVSDYYMELSTIKPDLVTPFPEISSEIESVILKGEVSFDPKKKAIIYKGKDTKQEMEMRDVSSMVSEISPITAYLKYIIGRRKPLYIRRGLLQSTPSSILFIEEPEAHLHPINQVALMKTFAKLVKQNVKLVMASHSNYIFNELNNLVLTKILDTQTYCPIIMKYENGKSNTHFMEMDELGVSDENFADITEEIFEEREALIGKLAQELQDQETQESTE